MNLNKRCVNCHKLFPAEPLEFKFFCDKKECQEYYNKYHFYTIKGNRHLPTHYFDLWDLDRPRGITDKGYIIDYERVCRVCGTPLLNKDGKYSAHRRYCGDHSGDMIWGNYNWGMVSKSYAQDVADKNKELIRLKMDDLSLENKKGYTNRFTICEECYKLCLIYDTYWTNKNAHNLNVINIHHKIPIHTLTVENLKLIWDKDNLISLCKDCHNQQDHQLKKEKVDPYKDYKKITEFVS